MEIDAFRGKRSHEIAYRGGCNDIVNVLHDDVARLANAVTSKSASEESYIGRDGRSLQ